MLRGRAAELCTRRHMRAGTRVMHARAHVLTPVPSVGTVMTGGVTSCTTTVNEALPVFPAASVAVHVTTVLPTWKTVAESGEHLGVKGPSTLSMASIVRAAKLPTAVSEVGSASRVSLGRGHGVLVILTS